VLVGGLHTCGVRAEGTIACWTLPAFGWHDNRTDTPPLPGTFISVSMGGDQHCALSRDGVPYCWRIVWTPPQPEVTKAEREANIRQLLDPLAH